MKPKSNKRKLVKYCFGWTCSNNPWQKRITIFGQKSGFFSLGWFGGKLFCVFTNILQLIPMNTEKTDSFIFMFLIRTEKKKCLPTFYGNVWICFKTSLKSLTYKPITICNKLHCNYKHSVYFNKIFLRSYDD